MTIRKVMLAILPFLYAGIFIYAPIKCFNLKYFWFNIVVFFIPSIILFLYLFPWLKREKWLDPFFTTIGVIVLVSSFFEYAAIGMNIWGFPDQSQYVHFKMLGILLAPLYRVPIEEFLFWWGATIFSILVYLYYNKLFKKPSEEGIAFALITIPFIMLTIKMFKLLHSEKVVIKNAILLLIPVFIVSLAPVEAMAIKRVFWKYNDILNFCPYGIPIEEWLIYYSLGPIFVVLLFHIFALRPKIQFLNSPNNK